MDDKVSIPRLHSIRLKGQDNVVPLDIVTTNDVNPQRLLMAAINARMQEVVIIGYDANGNEYFASSKADGGSVLWCLKRAEKKLLDIPEDYQ